MIAFFPCTRFQENNALLMSGQASQMKNSSTIDKLFYARKYHKELSEMYERISTLVQIALNRDLQLVIENPATTPHYLSTYWLPCSIVDKDRTVRGDQFKKPTQYWFFNREVHHNLVMKAQEQIEVQTIDKVKGKDRQVKRSMITDNYAENFIQEFIL